MLDLVEPRENLRGSLRNCSSCTRSPAASSRPRACRSPTSSRWQDSPRSRTRTSSRSAAPGTSSSWHATSSARTRSSTSPRCSTSSRSCTAIASSTRTRPSSALSRGWARSRSWSSAIRRATPRARWSSATSACRIPRATARASMMRHAAKFGMPIVTSDTPGAYPGLGGEERGQSIAIAQSIMEMSRLPVPIVTIVTGEGGSGGALALAVGDRVLMLENSYYSVISPEGCSTILFKDAAQAPGGGGAAPDGAAPAAPGRHGRRRAGAGRGARKPGRGRLEPEGGRRREPAGAARRSAGGAARAPLRALPGLRHARPPSRPSSTRRRSQ